jgi:hypothetical protein
LTDSASSLQAIQKWVRCGAKLNLSKTLDADVLTEVVIKLKKNVLTGAVAPLIKVKTHTVRGDSLNDSEEADITAEMGCLKEQ